ncbi:MAG: hypothetical protein NC099_00530 [Corallococcus sp.]|nr:hypothetical protein [Corallococcus sp.]
MKEKTPKTYIFYCIVLIAVVVCFVVGMCLFDFSCELTWENVTTANLVSFILFSVTVLGAVVLIFSAVITRAKKDKSACDEVELGCQLAFVLIAITVLCIPIFLVWVCQKIHDAISARNKEMP